MDLVGQSTIQGGGSERSIELPASVMFSDERKGVMQLLHQIVAAVEQKAIEMGFENSKAFAGGSCKEV